ncbi:PQQ-dependent sugar dehydrogenase [Corynebacterium callunae]|uniref:PQQ-dependent sugar dehydrogenase n=1 Tax=Corynebacterium callunae TaxID=1721 RepID=UPI0039825F90
MRRHLSVFIALATIVSSSVACSSAPTQAIMSSTSSSSAAPTSEFTRIHHATINNGWAMSFLPGTDFLAITQRTGGLQLLNRTTGELRAISGTPEVYSQGQAGMHDIIPGPTFESDGTVYLSWVRAHAQGAQGVVGRAQLDTATGALNNLEIIWGQDPAAGSGHFSLRLLIAQNYLFVTSGDRQLGAPAQDINSNLGGVLRLSLDGQAAPGNPWNNERWTMGNRNILGIAAAENGDIWISEMGPQGGDELNKIVGGDNYGWPKTSMGSNYDGSDIPDHRSDDGFHAPATYWVPSISPGNLLIYTGALFDAFSHSALIGGLSGQRLVQVTLEEPATELNQWPMNARIRALAQAPDGALWVLEDGESGNLWELRP